MTWFSIHFYPLEAPDVFLARALRPFLDTFVWREKGARAFFVRYDDEKGPHLRIRIRGSAEWLNETLRPALEGWFADRGTWEEIPYVPEKERFGGETALALAEEHFHVSTRVALDRIAREGYTYGDALFDTLRLHTITAFAAGLGRERAAWYFGELFAQWLPLFFQPADGGAADAADLRQSLEEQFEKSLAPQKDALRSALDELWNALESEKFDPTQPEWLRWYRGNQLIFADLGDNLEKALPSLLHLTANRLGVNNQDEVFLAYALGRLGSHES